MRLRLDKTAVQRNARAEVDAARDGAGTARAQYEHADAGCCFGTLPATNFDPQDGGMAASGSSELRVRPLLGLTGNPEACPCSAAAKAARSTTAEVNNATRVVLTAIWAAVGNRYPALVWPPGLTFKSQEGHAAGLWLLLVANAGCCPLERPATGTQDPRARACRHMIAKNVKAPRQAAGAAGSGIRSRRKGSARKRGDDKKSSSEMGRAVKTQAAYGPAWESSVAADAGSHGVRIAANHE